MVQYRDLAMEWLQKFSRHELIQIPQSENMDEDMLSKLLQEAPQYVSKIARIKKITTMSIDTIQLCPVEIKEADWIFDLKNYILIGQLPDDKLKAKKVKLQVP